MFQNMRIRRNLYSVCTEHTLKKMRYKIFEQKLNHSYIHVKEIYPFYNTNKWIYIHFTIKIKNKTEHKKHKKKRKKIQINHICLAVLTKLYQ